MSTTIGAVISAVPVQSVRTHPASPQAGTTADPQAGVTTQQGSEADAVTPASIQPLSNRILETFLQRDIELYGSMFGA